MPSRLHDLQLCLRSRLSRRIAAWVFLSILSIEAVILVPSYFRRRQELLNQAEAVAVATVLGAKQVMMQGSASEDLLHRIEQSAIGTEILGGSLYQANGQPIGTFGESPRLSAQDFSLQPAPHQRVLRVRSQDGSKYDIGWPANQLGGQYILILRVDTASVGQELQAFVVRIAGLVFLIAGVVTSTTMIVLGWQVIIPVLRLRDDLNQVGDALNQDQMQVNFYACSQNRQDELGDVMLAFRQMFDRVCQEINNRKESEAALRIEQEKSEKLLLNILPATIVQQLKEDQTTIAMRFDAATILFADIVNFTKLASEVSPTELVILLNQVFSTFDQLADKHHLEKIKTIGDAYMIVGGLPNPYPNHAQAVADLALDMQRAIGQFQHQDGEAFQIRIGINTGPVVAGVIGIRKFIYDLWGDAVNVASRMESQGASGCIQVTQATYEYLKDHYEFERRGWIQVKGKGEMMTYWLKGKKSAAPIASSSENSVPPLGAA